MSKEFIVTLGNEPSDKKGTHVRLVFDTQAGLQRGSFECWTHNGLGQYVEGGLTFEDKELTDYDGVYELPPTVRSLLEAVGIDTQPEFTVSVVRKLITEESADQGEYEELDTTIDHEKYDRSELASLLRDKGAEHCLPEQINEYLIFSSTQPDESRDYFERSERVYWDVVIHEVNDHKFNLERDFYCLPASAQFSGFRGAANANNKNFEKLLLGLSSFDENDLNTILNIIDAEGDDAQRVIDKIIAELDIPITVEESTRCEP